MIWYPWLNAHYRQLVSLYEAGGAHHALLINSIAGMGDEALVYALSRWLMCRQRQGQKSCGQCHGCCLMLSGNHPDWHVLMTEKKTSVGIDEVRQLTDKLYAHAQQGGEKVVWIPHTESLTDAAAHALLKTLEEPPEKTCFLLTCYEPQRLLATLRSRCFCWQLPCPDTALSLQWLSQQQAEHTEAPTDVERMTALKLSYGAPVAARDLLQPQRWQQRSAICRALMEGLSQRDVLSGLLPLLTHDETAEPLYWLSSLMLDALKWQQRAQDAVVNQDQQPLIQHLAAFFKVTVLVKLMDNWLTCRHQLLSVAGVNRELLLTEQLINWENALYPSSCKLQLC